MLNNVNMSVPHLQLTQTCNRNVFRGSISIKKSDNIKANKKTTQQLGDFTHCKEQRGGAVTETVRSCRVEENVLLVSITAALFL